MMARLPVPGGDDNTWGAILNDFITTEHNADGTHKAVVNPDATTNSKGKIKLSGDLAGTADAPTVPALQTKLDTALITAKGDLIAGMSAGTVTTLSRGSDGQVLVADAAQTLGIKWSAPDTSSMVLTVAASNAPAKVRAAADYVCTGTNDQTTINTALNTFYANSMQGGKVMLSAGTFTISGAIKLPIRCAVVGQGRSTSIVAADNATWTNGVDTGAATGAMIEPYDLNTSRTQVSDLELKGNKWGGANIAGIWYKTPGTSSTATTPQFGTTNNPGTDACHWFSGIYITETKQSGFHMGSNRAAQISNVRVFYVGMTGTVAHGFDIVANDAFYVNCEAGAVTGDAFHIDDANNQLSNCKGWFAEQNGFKITGTGVRTALSNCIAQDNKQHGFSIDVGPVTLASCHADSNSYDGSPSTAMTGMTYDGFHISASTNGVELVGCSAYDKNEDSRGYRQRYGYFLDTSTNRNIIIGTGRHNVTALFGGAGASSADNFILLTDVSGGSMLRMSGGSAVLPLPAAAPSDTELANNTVGMWLDETGGAVTMRVRKSDASYATAAVKLSSSGTPGGNYMPVVAASQASAAAKAAADYVCDGTNDESEINTALALGYGGCQLTGGVFTISAPILVGKEGVSLRGVGVGNDLGLTPWGGSTRIAVASDFTGTAAIKVTDTAATPTYLEPAVTIADFQLHGGGNGTSVAGIYWRGYEGVIENVQVRNMSGHGIMFQGLTGNPTYTARLTNVIATSNAGDGFRLDTYSQEVTFIGCQARSNATGWHFVQGHGTLCVISSCVAYGSTTHGIYFEGGGGGTKIVGSRIEYNSQHGIYFDTSGAGIQGVQISATSFDSNGRGTANTYDHICTQGTNGGGTNNLQINSCRFGNAYATGTLARYGVNLNAAVTYASVQGCTFIDGTLAGSGVATALVNFDTNARPTSLVRNNTGYITDNGGTSSLVSGGTIAHGLARTPTRYTVTPTVAGRVAVITSAGSTNLTVSLQDNAGTAIAVAENVVWSASC